MKTVLSVAIPTYNQEKYIEQALEGTVNQKTSFPFEIIIGEYESQQIFVVLQWQWF